MPSGLPRQTCLAVFKSPFLSLSLGKAGGFCPLNPRSLQPSACASLRQR